LKKSKEKLVQRIQSSHC